MFDTKTGKDSYGIMKVYGGAHQIVFLSTDKDNCAQFITDSDVLLVIFPSTNEKEFNRYVTLLGCSQDTMKRAVSTCGYGKVRPLTSFDVHYDRLQ